MSNYEWLDKRWATFAPERSDNLQPGTERLIGRTLEWQHSGLVESGPYEGQIMWGLLSQVGSPLFAWAPDEDLR